MAISTARVAALDFGASSGRVIVGEVGQNVLRTRQFARFPNRPVSAGGRLYWNVLALWQGAMDGLAVAGRAMPGLVSVASDTWGVDYGLLREGRLLANPTHYRDERTGAALADVHAKLAPEALFRRSGVEVLPINTIYQLAADQADGLLDAADGVLMMPDLFNYWLSGRRVAERTIASTTGLLNPVSGQWDPELLAAASVPGEILPEVVAPGTRLGRLLPEVAATFGVPRSLEVVAVGAHDTASAVVAAPISDSQAVYISCGTWGLVGMERLAPTLSEDARIAGFTNESGVDGRFLLMRNTMGLWLLSECMRDWENDGDSIDLRDLLGAAAAVTADQPALDVNDPYFAAPGGMPRRIVAWCDRRGVPAPRGKAETVRCIIESLAASFGNAAHETARVAGTPLTQINIVGGGALNELLCQRLADLAGVRVLAGPVEATALGNVLLQARTMGLLDGSLEELRELVRSTHAPVRYDPR